METDSRVTLTEIDNERDLGRQISSDLKWNLQVKKARLKRLGLTTLDERRIRGDMIQYFKRVKGFNKIEWFNPNTVTSLIIGSFFNL